MRVEHRDPGDLHQEERHQRRGEKRRPAQRRVESAEEEAPPEDGLAEVVRVTAEAPEAGVEDGSLRAGSASCARRAKRVQLRVGQGLGQQADDEEAEAEKVRERDWIGMACGRRQLQRCRDEDDQEALEEKHLEEAEPPVALSAVLSPERRVAWVLGLSPAPGEEVEPEADRPRPDHAEEECLSRREACPRDRERGDEEEADGPPGVHDAGVLQEDADCPERRHQGEDEYRIPDHEVERHASPLPAESTAWAALAAWNSEIQRSISAHLSNSHRSRPSAGMVEGWDSPQA